MLKLPKRFAENSAHSSNLPKVQPNVHDKPITIIVELLKGYSESIVYKKRKTLHVVVKKTDL